MICILKVTTLEFGHLISTFMIALVMLLHLPGVNQGRENQIYTNDAPTQGRPDTTTAHWTTEGFAGVWEEENARRTELTHDLWQQTRRACTYSSHNHTFCHITASCFRFLWPCNFSCISFICEFQAYALLTICKHKEFYVFSWYKFK